MNFKALIRMACYAAVLALLAFHYSPAVAQTSAESAGPSVDFNTYFTNLSSPRDTLQAFLATTDRFYDLIRDDGINPEEMPELRQIIAQQMRLFDLEDVPANLRQDTTIEAVVYLREALARVTLPPLEEVPDEDEMFARIKDGKLAIYVIPGTAIEIVYVEEGPYAHRFQFSADTVRDAEKIYRSDSFTLSLTREEMGALIGSSRETITRILHEYTENGMISIEGKTIKILDRKRLERISETG